MFVRNSTAVNRISVVLLVVGVSFVQVHPDQTRIPN